MKVKIDKEEIIVTSEDFCNANNITMTTGTNCPKGGNSSHGGRTYFKLEDSSLTNWDVIVDGKLIECPNTIEIILKGDCECSTFTDALTSASSILNLQYKNNENK